MILRKLRWLVEWSLATTPKMLRLTCFVAVMYVVAMAFALHKVHAEVEQMMLGLGAELMRFPGDVENEAREIHFNGAKINLRIGTVDGAMNDIVDHYTKLCEQRDAGLGATLAAAIKDPKARGVIPGHEAKMFPSLDGIIRANNGEAAVVACLDRGESPESADTLLERASRLVKTGNLTEMGQLRYIWARPSSADPEHKTFLMTMWTDAEVNIHKILPLDGGDAAGRDVEDIPRPAGNARRLLSSWETGKPYSLTAYATDSTPEELLSNYRATLPGHGWREIVPVSGKSVQVDGTHILAVEKGDEIAGIFVNQQENRAYVTILTSDSL